jgi:hypothetical protein
LQQIKFFFLLLILGFLTIQVGKTQDTLRTEIKDTLRTEIKDTVPMFRHSPTRAAILSAVVPGMGQIYNKKYWKLPLIYGGIGTLGYFVVHWNNLYQKYLNAYIHYNKFNKDESVLDGLPIKINKSWDINTQLNWYKDNYRRWRDLCALFAGAIYVLNIIDATVDAYLFNYDISADLSMRIEPAMINTYARQATPGIRLSFSLR